jgi:hypothetical protein
MAPSNADRMSAQGTNLGSPGLGPTVIVVTNNSAADPSGAIEVLGRDVLPALRRAKV